MKEIAIRIRSTTNCKEKLLPRVISVLISVFGFVIRFLVTCDDDLDINPSALLVLR